MSRNAFNDCEREYNRREEDIEMAKDQRSEAERVGSSQPNSNTQSSDRPTTAEAQKMDATIMTDTARLQELLHRQAKEIADEGHDGWGNTMKMAADRLDALEWRNLSQNERLRGELAEAKSLISFNANDSLKWRTLFQNERNHHQEANDLLRECLDWGLPEDLKERIDAAIGKKK